MKSWKTREQAVDAFIDSPKSISQENSIINNDVLDRVNVKGSLTFQKARSNVSFARYLLRFYGLPLTIEAFYTKGYEDDSTGLVGSITGKIMSISMRCCIIHSNIWPTYVGRHRTYCRRHHHRRRCRRVIIKIRIPRNRP